MNDFYNRRKEVLRIAAEQAIGTPLSDGLWFFNDVRDNLYFAMHLIGAACDEQISLSLAKQTCIELAEKVIVRVLRLQDRNPVSSTYGHWPLRLKPSPEEAKPNNLPVELTTGLYIYFLEMYKHELSEELQQELNITLKHVYNSRIFHDVPQTFNHHESKWRAAQMLLGWYFEDEQLMETGALYTRELLNKITEHGMQEYGALPWFWHWVQSFTFAWELMEDFSDIRKTLDAMLEFLWTERSHFYLKGAWVGAHSRCLPHDVPEDRNNLYDYIQYGDFQLPAKISRLEAYALLTYRVSAPILDLGLQREHPVEVKRRIPRYGKLGEPSHHLHSYTYITKYYAAGGVWERFNEYLNEQHRFDFTFPVDDCEGANQAFFYSPGNGHKEGDERKQGDGMDVLFHENMIGALFMSGEDSEPKLIGCLPLGEWISQERYLYGTLGNVYVVVHMMNEFVVEERPNRISVMSNGEVNGVVMEVIDTDEAARIGIQSLSSFEQKVLNHRPQFQASAGPMKLTYVSLRGRIYTLELLNGENEKRRAVKEIDGQTILFDDYRI